MVEEFSGALVRACSELAMRLLADAEGSDHEIAITTVNAASEELSQFAENGCQ